MSLRYLTAGESHGPALTAILDGIPAGLHLDGAIINLELARRQKGFGSGGRMKIEEDKVKILSGLMWEKTIGAPIAMLVENDDQVNWKLPHYGSGAYTRTNKVNLYRSLRRKQ